VPDPRYSFDEVAAAFGETPDQFLGAGSFGDTWRVGDRAVKLICVDGYAQARVDREINGLQRVASPHVVKLIETRTVPLGGQDRSALIFEYVEGGDLDSRLEAGDWPAVPEAQALLRGLLTGLADLHAAGTVHRDIKPANIALRGGDWSQPVILDLGLAKGIDEASITRYPQRVGTDTYMAPEQLRGHRAKKAADLFAAGVTVRLALSQRHPFFDPAVTHTHDDLVRAIEAGPPPLPSTVPAGVTDLLDRMVSATESPRGSAASNLRRLDKVERLS
jgi:eukaryotic-like serine/threonine-protein kinase